MFSSFGCAINSAVDITGTKKTEPQPSVELMGDLEPTDLALFHPGGRYDKVKVGDTWSSAKMVFPEPPRGAYEIHDLPSQFSDKFESEGWETSQGEGFGAILTESKVASAIYEMERERAPVVNELIDQEIAGMGPKKPKVIPGGRATYWFWHDKNQTLMVCRLITKQGANLTMALGDDNVLKQLSISEEDAKRQIADLENLPPKP